MPKRNLDPRDKVAKTEAFLISRVFDAPRDIVWRAWTEPEQIKNWWGPTGNKNESVQIDLKVGGINHYAMTTPEGKKIWGKQIYRQIENPELLVFIGSFSDEKGSVIRHPSIANFPLELLTTVRFTELKSKTSVMLEWIPVNATAIEIKTFDDDRSGMNQGWGGSFDRLEVYLNQERAN